MTTYKFNTFIICVIDSGQGHDIPLLCVQNNFLKNFPDKLARSCLRGYESQEYVLQV